MKENFKFIFAIVGIAVYIIFVVSASTLLAITIGGLFFDWKPDFGDTAFGVFASSLASLIVIAIISEDF